MLRLAPTSVAYDGYHVVTAVSRSEPRSIGTHQVHLTYPSGARIKFQGERVGMIERIWLDDLDGDEVPELVIWMVSVGSGSYAKIDLYRLADPRLNVESLDPLSEAQAAGYIGHDRLEIVEGRLVRCFPVYRRGDTMAAPTGGERCLCYSMEAGAWRDMEEKAPWQH
jgi:hypothetical protein